MENNEVMLQEAAMVPVQYDVHKKPTVWGRDLHKVLGIETEYRHWFPRMCEYGFREGRDFNPVIFDRVQREGEREVMRQVVDHQLEVGMAKEICMIQRSEIGKKCREYFLRVEEEYKKLLHSYQLMDPVERALMWAEEERERQRLEKENREQKQLIAIQEIQIAEMQPKVTYYDMVLQCTKPIPISVIAKDYGFSARELNERLHSFGVQYKCRETWLLYQQYADKGYTKTKTYPYQSGEKMGSHVHTYWTQKGRLFIYDTLKKYDVYPLIEREEKDDG